MSAVKSGAAQSRRRERRESFRTTRRYAGWTPPERVTSVTIADSAYRRLIPAGKNDANGN